MYFLIIFFSEKFHNSYNQAEQYERIYLPTNTRAVQTEKSESEPIESSDEEQQQMRTAQDQLQSHERPWTGKTTLS